MRKMLLLALAFLLGFAAPALAAEVELNFVSLHPDKHPATINALIPWQANVAKLTGGKVEVARFNIGVLCPDRETYDSVAGGAVDMGSNVCSATPGKFPLNEMFELPMFTRGSLISSLVIHDLSLKYPEWNKEFSDIHLLWQWATPPFQLHTLNKPVNKLEDLKGMKILVWSASMLDTLKLLGANPIQVLPTDTYLSLSRGMGDGVVAPMAVFRAFKLNEVSKYHTICDISAGAFWGGINKTRWEKLPKEVQDVLTSTTGMELSKACSTAIDNGSAADTEWLKQNGHTVITMDAAERARWVAAAKPVYDNWLKRAADKKLANAPRILADAQALTEKYAAEKK